MTRNIRWTFGVFGVAFLLVFQSILSAGDNAKSENCKSKTADPILADLKTTVKAEWWPEFDHNGGKPKPRAPTLVISVELEGTAAKQASKFGELKLDAVIAQDGKSYSRACEVFRGDDMMENFLKINAPYHSDKGFRLDLDIPNRPPIQSFREIRGSLALQTGGEFKKVVVQNAFKNLSKASDETFVNAAIIDGDIQWIAKPLEGKSLKRLGVKIATKRLAIQPGQKKTKDCVAIEVQSVDPIVDCDVLDAKGKPLTYVCYAFSGSDLLWQFDFDTTETIPPDAQLQLIFHKNSRKIRVPFVLKDIKVPPVPEEQEK